MEDLFILKAWNKVIGRSQNVRATGNALHVKDDRVASIDQGEAYHLGVKFAIAPSATVFFAATPNLYPVHWTGLSVAALTGPVEVNFYKDSVVGSGSTVSPNNRMLNVGSSCSANIEQVHTITTTGTLVSPTVVMATPALGGRVLPAEEAGIFQGFVLATSATYAVGMLNTSVDTADVWVDFAFSEPRTI